MRLRVRAWIQSSLFPAITAVLIAALVVASLPLLNRPANAAITEWGLGFGADGSQPRGNVSAEELAKYGAYYVASPQEKAIYLTFDAGYENGNTEKILDTLREKQVPAAFFLVGSYVRQNAELVRRMAQEGHVVGNHTDEHKDMRTIQTQEAFAAALAPVEQAYTQATGQPMPKFYRPPEGTFNESNLRFAQALGYTTVFWSLAYRDWVEADQPTAEYAFGKLCPRMHNGAILLLHSTSATNAAILGELIDRWQGEGYVFKSLYDLTQSGGA